MDSKKYIGMDVHKEDISIVVMNGAGKIVMESVIETKASVILQFFDGLCGDLQATFEEGPSAAWLYDLLNPHATKLVVVRSYLTITKDLGRVMTGVKAIYRSWAIPCTGKQV